MDVERLRRETAPDHAATERLLPLMDPHLTLPLYVATLRRFHQFLQGWERWARKAMETMEAREAPDGANLMDPQHGPERDAAFRLHLLERDLRHFGETVPVEPAIPFHLPSASRASYLGSRYVVQGSTLGGQYIARHVQVLFGLRPGEGNAYFAGAGEHTGSLWKGFLATLAQLPESEGEEVIAAARSTFGQFAACFGQVYQGHGNP